MTTHNYPYTMVDGHLILDCEGRRLLLDTGAPSCVYPETTMPFAGTREDFFPGLGTFESDTFETPITLGEHTVTITTGALTAIPAMALGLVGAKGILGSALFDHFAVACSPRRGKMALGELNGKGA